MDSDRIGTATYSPEDNKIRIDPLSRLDSETYKRVRAAGFIWAPRQKIFVAPMWTPDRADLAEELCGEIEDEDKSLVERAEERAERFEDYSNSRAKDAEQAHKAVESICDGIPLGQPILVGHHSEKHARRDAKKIENGMRRAVKMWETSKYWQERARGAIRAAKYKERPDVRARRIKGLEAEIRSYKARYTPADTPPHIIMQSDWNESSPDAPKIPHVWCAPKGGRGGSWVRADSLPGLEKYYSRWIQHCELRLEYERAMLGEAGGTVTDRKGPEKGGAVRYWDSPGYGAGWAYIQKVNKVSITLLDNWGNGGRNLTRTIEFDNLKAVMTKAEVEAAREAGKLKEIDGGRGFYLMESREAFEAKPENQPAPDTEPDPGEKFDALREAVKLGVSVAVVNQLFPTPLDLAARMAREADIREGFSILEPSAGTGVLLDTLTAQTIDRWSYGEPSKVVAVEINPTLAKTLRTQYAFVDVTDGDFLECGNLGRFDRILMNPPFQKGEDIKHILHAFEMLKPGGRLVAICANGPRQQEKLKTWVEELGGTWEALPAGTFEKSGTGVNTALLVVDAPEGDPEPAPLAPAFKIEFPMTGGAVTISRDAVPLPGMSEAIAEQRQAAAATQGEALTEKFNRPPADLSAKTGNLERRAPLFSSTDASGQGRLF